MAPVRKHELDQRLAAYSATLRSSRLEETRKRRSGNWQVYAAVTGSALAMATNASAGTISINSGPINVVAGPLPNLHPASKSYTYKSQRIQLTNGGSKTIPVGFSIGVAQFLGEELTQRGSAWLNGGAQVGFLHSTRFVKKLSSGANISALAGPFRRSYSPVAAQRTSFIGPADPIRSYGWPKSAKGFAGFSFSYNGQTDYGWVQLRYTVGSNGLANEIEAYEWQYTTEGSASPEPSTFALALLAAGAAGVAALRRRRKAAA
jgi:MYXO-CTERM domain-containing protein